MAENVSIYDLVLLLSSGAPEQQRAKVLSDVESAIGAAGGSIETNQDWGARPMTYQIAHQADAEYHLLQFSGPPELLENLNHSLRIMDGVLRHRIIKVIPGTPAPPEHPPPVVVAARSAPAPEPEPED